MEPIIELKNLTKTFGAGGGQVSALRDVSLAVYPGEIFGIIGASFSKNRPRVPPGGARPRPDIFRRDFSEKPIDESGRMVYNECNIRKQAVKRRVRAQDAVQRAPAGGMGCGG